MGRKRESLPRNFFNYDSEKNVSECKICKKIYVGNYIANLKRHLESAHKEVYINESNDQPKCPAPEKKIKFSVSLANEKVKESCVKLVTTERIPFTVLDSEAFKTLTAQIFSGLDMQPITSKNVISFVEEKYQSIKLNITKALNNKLICLKIDTATRCSRGILGINVQYYDGDRISVKTLSLIELQRRHTAINLCAEIEAVLDDFGIRKNQIYSVTTDNGRNMTKAVELMNEETDNDDGSGEEEQVFDEELLTQAHIFSIQPIKCAAHTLQLAVKNFFEAMHSFHTIEKARSVVKILRTPSYRCMIAERSLLQPQIDVATRWNSTYIMLKRLLQFEDFCEEHLRSNLNLTAAEWGIIGTLTATLEPVYIATQKLQSEQLYMGDFYKLWLELKLTVDNMKNEYSSILSNCLKSRETALLENKVVVCAVFLDPRIRRVILQNPINVMHARTLLKQLFLQLRNVSQTNNTTPTPSESQPEAFVSSISIDAQTTSTCSLLNEFLNSIAVSSNDESDDAPNEEIAIAYNEIDNYNPKPIDINKNIMSYWEDKKYIYPHLYQLAKIVHATPATQVSVERSFSALKLVLTDLRCNLSTSIIVC